MARKTDEDYQLLLEFLGKYSLNDQLHDNTYLQALRIGHRKYLGLLTLWTQIESDASTASGVTFGRAGTTTPVINKFLTDLCSDASESFFCASQGAYKAAYSMLRSCIENYIRAFGSLANPAIGSIQVVHQLFDEAKLQPFFKTTHCNIYFSSIRNSYGSLCNYVHSGLASHSNPVHALNYFPKFDIAAYQAWLKLFDSVVKSIINSIVVTEPQLFLRLHFKSQDVLAEQLHRKVLILIHGGNINPNTSKLNLAVNPS